MSTQAVAELASREAAPPQAQALEPAAPGERVRRVPKYRGIRRLAVGLIALLAAVAGMIWWHSRAAPTVHYVTVPIAYGDIARRVVATGTVNPELTIMVGTYVSGVIEHLYCDYNSKVKAGQICAKIDARPYQVVVNQAKANLAAARAQLEKDKANLAYATVNDERNQWLLERDSTSKDAADLARSARNQAQAQIGLDEATIEQRKAELAAAQVNLGYTDIVSPVDGTVVSRNVTQGQTVAASFQTPTLFLIATDLTKMQVDTNVSESDISATQEGARATFTVDAFPKRVFRGVVTQVRQSPQTVQNVVTFDVVVAVDNRDLALKPGMTASTRIIADQRTHVLHVPNQALRYTPGGLAAAGRPGAEGVQHPVDTAGAGLPPEVAGTRIWVLRNGQPVAVAVTPGLDDENYTEILKGDVQPGDDVVIAEERSTAGAGGKARPAAPRG